MAYEKKIDGTDVSFEAQSGQTVLEAASKCGIELPYSCRKGVCGNCKGKVISGDLVLGTGGGSHETGCDEIDDHLFCVAQPASNLVIKPHSWRKVDPNARKTITATVFKNELVANDISILNLRFPTGVRVRFAAGQYLEVLLPNEERRAFSMANAPHENDSVQLHIRHMPGGGFTQTVVPKLVKGDKLNIELPHGDFFLREDTNRPLLFIAGGTGFAPIKSIIENVIKRNIQRQMTLFWGAREPEDLYALELIKKWQLLKSDFRFEGVISDGSQTEAWTGMRGRLHQVILDNFENVSNFDVYVCGAPVMVNAVRSSLIDKRGLPANQFFSDSFVESSINH